MHMKDSVACRDLLLSNERETTTTAARQQILNKQIYVAVTE
jgi:hypothetical protein